MPVGARRGLSIGGRWRRAAARRARGWAVAGGGGWWMGGRWSFGAGGGEVWVVGGGRCVADGGCSQVVGGGRVGGGVVAGGWCRAGGGLTLELVAESGFRANIPVNLPGLERGLGFHLAEPALPMRVLGSRSCKSESQMAGRVSGARWLGAGPRRRPTPLRHAESGSRWWMPARLSNHAVGQVMSFVAGGGVVCCPSRPRRRRLLLERGWRGHHAARCACHDVDAVGGRGEQVQEAGAPCTRRHAPAIDTEKIDVRPAWCPAWLHARACVARVPATPRNGGIGRATDGRGGGRASAACDPGSGRRSRRRRRAEADGRGDGGAFRSAPPRSLPHRRRMRTRPSSVDEASK